MNSLVDPVLEILGLSMPEMVSVAGNEQANVFSFCLASPPPATWLASLRSIVENNIALLSSAGDSFRVMATSPTTFLNLTGQSGAIMDVVEKQNTYAPQFSLVVYKPKKVIDGIYWQKELALPTYDGNTFGFVSNRKDTFGDIVSKRKIMLKVFPRDRSGSFVRYGTVSVPLPNFPPVYIDISKYSEYDNNFSYTDPKDGRLSKENVDQLLRLVRSYKKEIVAFCTQYKQGVNTNV